MAFKKRTVAVNGAAYHLRELSAGAVECVNPAESEYSQALTMLALSLCGSDGTPDYTPDRLGEGLAYVRALPASLVRDHLLPAATALNTESEDDARGN